MAPLFDPSQARPAPDPTLLVVHTALFVQADETLREAVELADEPDWPHAYSELGHVLFLQGEFEEARKCYEQAVASYTGKFAPFGDVPPLVYLRLGNTYLRAESYSTAKEVFLRACKVTPCATMWLGVGGACMRNGELEEAEAALTEANLYDNENAQVWGQLALLCLQWRPQRGSEADAAFAQARLQVGANAESASRSKRSAVPKSPTAQVSHG